MGRLDKVVAAWRENVLTALRTIRVQKLRSFLTCLGIIIGVATVIVMVSLIQGFNRTFIAQFENFGATMVQFQRLDDRFGHGGPLPEDAIAYRWALPPARKRSIRDYRIGFVLDHPLCPVTGDVKDRLRLAVESLRKAGARLEEGFPAGVDLAEQYRAFLEVMWVADLAGSSKEELDRIRAMNAAPDDVFTSTMKHAVDASAFELASARDRQLVMRQAWQRYFGEHDAFLMPADFVPAFAHDHAQPDSARVLVTPEGPRRYWDQLIWASIASLTGLPATVAPVGLTRAGLPVGIQILGPWLEDATPIFVAEAFEREFGFQVPPGFE